MNLGPIKFKNSRNISEVILEAAVVGLPGFNENASESEESLHQDSDQKRMTDSDHMKRQPKKVI